MILAKLPYLDSYCNARKKAAEFYSNAFKEHPNIVTPKISKFSTHVFHQYTLKITNQRRDELHKYLIDKNIPNAIYYPVPLHAQKAYKDSRYHEKDFTGTNQLVNEVISLPMHTELDTEQLDFISQTVLTFFK